MNNSKDIESAKENLAARLKEVLDKPQNLKSNRLSEVKVDLPADLHRQVFNY